MNGWVISNNVTFYTYKSNLKINLKQKKNIFFFKIKWEEKKKWQNDAK